jgi:hypothetical protein
MDADERRRTEAAMANISRMRKAVEADPAAAMQASLDASMALVKRRLLHILFWVVLAAAVAAAIAFYLRGRA